MELPNTKALHQDSGALWLGSIPENWQLKKLKFLVSCVGGGTPNTGNPEFWAGDIPWVSPKDMKRAVIDSTEDYLTELGVRSSATALISAGAVLIVVRSGILRHSIPVALNSVEVSLNQDMKALIPNGDLSSSFLYWIVEGNQSQLLPLWSKPGCTVESIELTYLLNTEMPVPSDEEQQAITRFLDYKTAQIDALIAKKQALLERLAEKRTALISHAVTKGLDPSVPMKNSGVAWLGEIPQHWTAIRIRYVSEFVTSGSRGWAEHYSDEGSVFLRITNVSRTSVDLLLDGIKRVLPPDGAEGRRTATHSGDVVVSITADLGSVAVIPDNYEAAYVSQHLALVRPIPGRIHGRWMAYQISSFSGQAQLTGAGYGGTKIQLSLGDIKDVWIALPPPDEQQEICFAIDKSVARLELQASKVRKVIERLSEYRSALITNAVTGKIDVRNFEIPSPARESVHA